MTLPAWYDPHQASYALLAVAMGACAWVFLRSRKRRGEQSGTSGRSSPPEAGAADRRLRIAEAQLRPRASAMDASQAQDLPARNRRAELQELENRLLAREELLSRRLEQIEKRELVIAQRQDEVQAGQDALALRRQQLDREAVEHQALLHKLAGLTAEEARREVLQRQEREARADAAAITRRLQEEARAGAEREARRLITMAVQRYAAPHASEMMTCAVPLPGEDAKGRIIGRDGRNIRAFEAVTGVNILIDDTPELVVISGFDPIRREIARLALVLLVADGRIHPARIEEVVSRVQQEMDAAIREQGEQAVYDARLMGVAPELFSSLGRLKFRTSFSQNVLQHSLEVAHLMGAMASELGLDAAIARRIGLFHDIGKSIDHQVEGAHAAIGADLLRRWQEDPVVVEAVAAHHGEVEAHSLYAALCSAADAISSSRPGARNESTEIYLQRLEKLEAIANSLPGVRKSFAVQAGREVRVIVDPAQIDDAAAILLARDISKRIEAELRYPGQIRVVVVRETRSVEFAR